MTKKSRTRRLSPVLKRSNDFFVDYGQGIYLYNTDGERFIDFTSGMAVTNTGHSHPKVVEAIQQQTARLIHGQANIVYHEPMMRLCEELSTIVPTRLDTFFFGNSGAEAVEASIKLAKAATGKQNIIVFQGSFHGRTHATMAMSTSKTIYRTGYQPLMPGIFVAPFPSAYAYGWSEEIAVDYCLRELRHLLRTQSDPRETAAIVIEPVIGEGGYIPAPKRFMQGIRQICNENGVLMVADEVQSGFGRTGKWFAYEHSGVVPDIMVMAKGLASGMPLSGIAARNQLMAKWLPGTHGSTFGGNAVACAAAVATIEVMREEELINNSAQMGTLLKAGLKQLQERFPEIGDVRGLGLMIACEFNNPEGDPWADRAQAVVQACYRQKLLLLTAGSYDNVIRWIPPLIVDQKQLRESLTIFNSALEEARSAN
jgi:4-aminobutyrate aminotransferase